MALEIEELNQTNCKTYLVSSGQEAVLIDPVRERAETYRSRLESGGLQLRYILETHMHADHLMFDRDLLTAFGGEMVMHEQSPSPLVTRHVVHDDVLEIGRHTIRVLHTPGHTPDSVCFVVRGGVFTGDTLLIGGTGRTDFPGGDAGAQYSAIREMLFALPDDTVVYPAHDYRGQQTSTIGKEKNTNQRLQVASREEYVEKMANLNLPLPEHIQQSLQVNQSGFHAGEVLFPSVLEVAAVEQMLPKALEALIESDRGPLLIDVREPEEFVGELGHIRGALLVPLDALGTRMPKLLGYVDRAVVCICRAGARSASACAMLKRAGFSDVKNLADGMLGWVREGLAVEH